MENLTIKFIIIIPRSRRFASYYINDSDEVHVLKYDNLFKFLVSLLPKRSTIINQLLYAFRNFIVNIEKSQVYELSFNSEIEIQKLKEKHRKFDYKKIEKKKRKEKELSIDKVIENIALKWRLPKKMHRTGLKRDLDKKMKKIDIKKIL